MNKTLMRLLGFEKTLVRSLGFEEKWDLVDKGLCPLCGNKIGPEEFRDLESRREFIISGLCQSCQDDIFGRE